MVMPVGARFPSLRQRVTVKFGEPLDLAHHGPAESGKARRLATDDIMAAIHALSGQELANIYNEAPAHNPIERIRQVLPHERR
jgi:1-acyl-sn-glycerol-3-phosphate acyltransferase